MLIKGLVDEDFTNYKKPSMFIIFPYCTFKCDKEAGCTVCQNSTLANEPTIEIQPSTIVSRYIQNHISKAIVLGGLEPFDSKELLMFIEYVRDCVDDEIVIYTGYTEEEISDEIQWIQKSGIKNIIIKFGRFIPNQEKHYDEVLGVELASPNQYARRIS